MRTNNAITDYLNPSDMATLCEEILLPGEVTEKILAYLKTYGFAKAAPHFDGICSVETGQESVKALEDALKDDDADGLLTLTVYLLAALRAWDSYAAMGISRDIYVDTMKAFSRFVNEHRVSYERYGFDRGYWTYRQLSLVLFRLGALEFELRPIGNMAGHIGADAKPEDLSLSVHIPSDAVMTREALNDSYRQAASFMAKSFPDYAYRHVWCSTWLLAPALAEILPQSARILTFQADYTLKQIDEENASFMQWVYKRKYERYEDLPETTSLARAIKARLLAGGRIGAAFGIVEDFAQKYGQSGRN